MKDSCSKPRCTFIRNWAHAYVKPPKAQAAMEPAIASLGIPYRIEFLFANKYRLDYYIPSLGLCIEVDGDSHNTLAEQIKDQNRTAWLRKYDVTVVRCKNKEALKDPYAALHKMLLEAGHTDLAQALPKGKDRG